MIQYGVLNFRIIIFTNKHCFIMMMAPLEGIPNDTIGKFTMAPLVAIGTNDNQRTLSVFRQPMVPLVNFPIVPLVELRSEPQRCSLELG